MKKKVLNNVREIRRKLDLTQEELAKSVGVSRLTILSIEKMKYEPSISIALALAKELKTDIDKLFWMEEV